MEFRILGPLEALADGRALAIPSGQQRALLALLVLNANRVLSPDRIAEEVWGDRLPGSGTKALAFHVSRLRDALSPGRRPGAPAGGLETEAGGYVLRVDPEAIDAVRFERLAREAHGRLAEEPAAARTTLEEALALWRGDALSDVAYAEFAQVEIRRLDELRLGAREDRLEADLALGGHLAAVAELQALLAANPLEERLRGLLVLALYRSGRQAEALRVAGAGRRLISEELGIDPSPELVRLEERILAQDPGLDLARRPAGPGSGPARNPYKGLRAFGEADTADFFGREALVGRLVARLEEVVHAGRLLAVVGPSGSGKSSVVRAGLIPALRAGAAADGGPWRIATMVPGTAPFRELAAGLAAGGHPVARASVDLAERTGDLAPVVAEALVGEEPHANGAGAARPGEAAAAGPAIDRVAVPGGTRLLLVIDQLEELFVRVDEETRSRFVDGLVAALTTPGTPLVVVATLRADFLHVPLLVPELGELLRGGLELVTPLTRVELERAIERPAEAVGAEVEPGLVAEMVADVEHRPGALPLLQYALTELFDRSAGRRLSRDGYSAIGGATGALGRRADEAWRSLDAEGREIAQQVLLRLVALGDGGVATARRVPRAELESLPGDGGRVGAVLDDLGRRGLLTFDLDPVGGAPTVQIAHEALLAHWSRLADWIEDLREDLWARRRLADAVDEWQAAGRSAGFLAAGAKLDRFEAWARGTRLRLSDGERAFLAASAEERGRLAGVEAERAARERRLERRARVSRRVLVGVLVVGVVLAGGLSAALLGDRQAAVDSQAVALARELAAGSVANLGTSRQLSVLLALEAADATTSRGYVVEEAYDALQWALQGAQVAYPAGGPPVGVRQAPDGPRGVFLVAPEVLLRLGTEYIGRLRPSGTLTSDECRIYRHAETCPAVQAPRDGATLGVRSGSRVVSAAALAVGVVPGTHVRVLSELPVDVSPLVRPFERESGVTVDWDPALGGDLEARVAARDLPDVAIVSRPSYVAAAARDGWLLDLAALVDAGLLDTAAGVAAAAPGLGPGAGSAASGDAGRRYGVPVAASVEDLLWYPARAFAAAGYEAPTTPDQLADLVVRLRADGRTPWCLGSEAGSRTGSAAAAWVEDLFLDAQGPASYDRWTRGETAFGSPEVRAAVEAFGAMVKGRGDVLEELRSVNLIPDRIAWLPMLALDAPRCWLYRGASTVRAAFSPEMASRAAAVPFPTGSPGSHPVLGRLYTVVVLHDRPEVRRLAETLVGVPFATAIASDPAGAGIFPVRRVAVPAGGVAAAEAQRLRAGLDLGTFRVRAVDLVPGNVAAGFMGDLTSYLRFGDPSTAGMDFTADAEWAAYRAEVPH